MSSSCCPCHRRTISVSAAHYVVGMGIQATQRLTPVAVLAELSACDHAEKAAAARRLELAVVWAGLHPGIAAQPYDKVVDSLIDEATGATVAAIAEFAAVHGVSTNAGRQLIADAVTLCDRLPRCWQRMTELKLPAWKARLLAQMSYRLGNDAVSWLDAHAAVLGDKLGVRTIKRLALTAIARFEPEKLTDPAQNRWVRIGPDSDQVDGASWIDGRLDTPDALDLEAALRLIAADLAAEGVDVDLDTRRAQALGVMARQTLGRFELPVEEPTEAPSDLPSLVGPDESPCQRPPSAVSTSSANESQRLPASDSVPGSGLIAGGEAFIRPGRGAGGGRPASIYLHFDAAQLATCTGLGELGSTGQLVTIEQIRAWCGTAGSITIRPVIDLRQTRTTRTYQPTDVMREHIALRDKTCVFPHCTRSARPVRQRSTGDYSHDADHIAPYESGGETSTDNLACLCRLHHLLKTHTEWRYSMIGPGEYLWTSPTGQRLLRTNSGTTLLTTPRRREKPEAA